MAPRLVPKAKPSQEQNYVAKEVGILRNFEVTKRLIFPSDPVECPLKIGMVVNHGAIWSSLGASASYETNIASKTSLVIVIYTESDAKAS